MAEFSPSYLEKDVQVSALRLLLFAKSEMRLCTGNGITFSKFHVESNHAERVPFFFT